MRNFSWEDTIYTSMSTQKDSSQQGEVIITLVQLADLVILGDGGGVTNSVIGEELNRTRDD